MTEEKTSDGVDDGQVDAAIARRKIRRDEDVNGNFYNDKHNNDADNP